MNEEDEEETGPRICRRTPDGVPPAPRLTSPPSQSFDRSRADVAQLVEQLIRNQQVGGSSPPVGSKTPLEMRTYRRASAKAQSADFRVRTVSVFSAFMSTSSLSPGTHSRV